jgi:hypothetical protein
MTAKRVGNADRIQALMPVRKMARMMLRRGTEKGSLGGIEQSPRRRTGTKRTAHPNRFRATRRNGPMNEINRNSVPQNGTSRRNFVASGQ